MRAQKKENRVTGDSLFHRCIEMLMGEDYADSLLTLAVKRDLYLAAAF